MPSLSLDSLPLGRVVVSGPSMAPALRDGEILLVRWGRPTVPFEVGDVVVIELPDRPLGVKRVTRIEDTAVCVEGDNPYASTDSRVLGPLALTSVRGRVMCRLWPRPGRVAARAG